MSEITHEQVDYYHDNGFLSLPKLAEDDELAMMREAYDRIFADKAGRDEGNEFDLAGSDEDDKEASLPQILDPGKYAPELHGTRTEAKARAIAAQLLCPGHPEKLQGGLVHAILKPAHHGAPTPWHQDEAYWDPGYEYHRLSVWLPLQEANMENGCMHFLPGSQKGDIVEHQSIGKDTRVHGLEVCEPNDIDFSRAVPCPIPAGGVTIHGNRTLHYAGPNNSDGPRRALIFSFGLEPTEYPEKRRFPWNEIKQAPRQQRAKGGKATM